jgi:hypothetical protein
MKRISVLIALILTLLVISISSSVMADDGVTKITVKNNTSEKAFVALMWWDQGSDSSSWTKGWWSVEAGKSRVITWPGHRGPYIVGNMGYYAKAKGLVWAGKNTGYKGWIHPKNPFEAEAKGKKISGSQLVPFRVIGLTMGKDGNAIGTITLKK